jgi:hypothetical protein
LVRHSQRSPHFESGKFVGRFLPRFGALLIAAQPRELREISALKRS